MKRLRRRSGVNTSQAFRTPSRPADSSAVGYYFSPQVSSANREGGGMACEVFTPDRRRRRFRFDYDPMGNGGTGRATVTLDGRAYVLDLTPGQRKGGAAFNRFGLANVRSGGHSIEIFLDDVTYTARREAGTRPKFIPQTTLEVPSPHKQAGRRF